MERNIFSLLFLLCIISPLAVYVKISLPTEIAVFQIKEPKEKGKPKANTLE